MFRDCVAEDAQKDHEEAEALRSKERQGYEKEIIEAKKRDAERDKKQKEKEDIDEKEKQRHDQEEQTARSQQQ